MKRFIERIALITVVSTLLIGTAAGASKDSKAATSYRHYYNVYMVGAFNNGMKKQNSSDPAISAAGIRLEIAAINRFDNKISTIKFPSSAKSAFNDVLNDDAAWVTLEGTLAINTSNTSNFDTVFALVQPAQAKSYAAIYALARKIGLNWH